MIVSLSAEAEAELIGAARHHAREGGRQLGLALITEFERTLAMLSEHPQLGAPWRGRKRMSLRRFPYSVINYVSDHDLRVAALAHHRRKPGYWVGRGG